MPVFCLRKVKITIVATILLLAWVLFCVPTPALALDFKIREFFGNKVERSDRFIDNFNEKADGIVNDSINSVSFYTRQGFSALETLTGLSEQNQLYRYSKNNWLKTIGFGLGVLEGTKDFTAGTASLLAYLESSPARVVTLAYNVQERPQEYKEKALSGGKTVAGILANPVPLVGGLYQWGKNTYVEARQDPLKMGQLQGEVATFGATLLLGGSQVRALTASNKAINTAKAGSMMENAASLANTGALANTGTIASAGTLANTGVVVPGGILAKVTAAYKNMDIGGLIPDFSRLNFGLAGTPVLAASTGKSIGGITLKGAMPKHYLYSETTAATSNKAVSTFASAETKTAVKYPLDVEKLQRGVLKNPEYFWIRELCVPTSLLRNYYEWGKKQFEIVERILLPQEKEAISRYTVNARPYNSVLRGADEKVSPQITTDLQHITNGLNKCSITEPIYVFRGTTKTCLGRLACLPPERLVGQEIVEKGLMSTSMYPRPAFIGGWNGNGLAMVIKVPEGTKGAYLGDLSALPHEAEVLFPPGQKLIIKEADWILDQATWPDGIHLVVELQS